MPALAIVGCNLNPLQTTTLPLDLEQPTALPTALASWRWLARFTHIRPEHLERVLHLLFLELLLVEIVDVSGVSVVLSVFNYSSSRM